MKTTAVIRYTNHFACRRRAYKRSIASFLPNSAGISYFAEKVLDAALAAATTLGVVVILMFSFVVFG